MTDLISGGDIKVILQVYASADGSSIGVPRNCHVQFLKTEFALRSLPFCTDILCVHSFIVFVRGRTWFQGLDFGFVDVSFTCNQ